MSLADERPQPARSGSQPKPRGILKNAPQGPNGLGHLQWDEENIAATEVQKDSLMKITEPKTPYVRYNAETDTIEGDIPTLDLGRASSPFEDDQPVSPTMTLSSTGADASSPSSRRTSFSSSGRPGTSMSHRSGSSSRSTSFNLPNENRHSSRSRSPGGEVEFEDEEMDEEAAKRHEEFLRARGRHYSNEAEAMKRAKELMAQEDDDMSGIPPVPGLPATSSFEGDDEGESMEYAVDEEAGGPVEDTAGEVNGVNSHGAA